MLSPVELMAVKKKTSHYWSMGHAVVSAIWASTQVNLVMVSRALSNAIKNVVLKTKLNVIHHSSQQGFKKILSHVTTSHDINFCVN